MPAALDIDREAVRVLVVAIGPRAAARELGLEEDTVCQWSSRYEWVKQAEEMRVKAAAANRERAKARGELSSVVSKSPADALAEVIATEGTATRIGAVRYARKAVEHAGSLCGADALAVAGDVKQAMQVLAIADGSGAGSTTTSVQVNLLSQTVVQWDEA